MGKMKSSLTVKPLQHHDNAVCKQFWLPNAINLTNFWLFLTSQKIIALNLINLLLMTVFKTAPCIRPVTALKIGVFPARPDAIYAVYPFYVPTCLVLWISIVTYKHKISACVCLCMHWNCVIKFVWNFQCGWAWLLIA